jgi:hypothetical protein
MKRDLELIRKIMLKMEDAPTGAAPEMEIEGYSRMAVGYHSYLIVDAALAAGCDAATRASQGSPEWILTHLTSLGHDFAEAARNEGRWKKALQKAGALALPLFIEALIGSVKGKLGMS